MSKDDLYFPRIDDIRQQTLVVAKTALTLTEIDFLESNFRKRVWSSIKNVVSRWFRNRDWILIPIIYWPWLTLYNSDIFLIKLSLGLSGIAPQCPMHRWFSCTFTILESSWTFPRCKVKNVARIVCLLKEYSYGWSAGWYKTLLRL